MALIGGLLCVGVGGGWRRFGGWRFSARLIRLTVEGTWLEMMTLLNPYDEEEAKRTVWTCLHRLYPRHFGPDGPLSP